MVHIPPKPRDVAKHLPRTLPARSDLPISAPDGTLMQNAGKYARLSVLTAFEMIGGTPALAAWAEENPGEFYTKLFTRTIGKDVEHTASQGVEAMLTRLDGASWSEQDPIDVDFTEVDDGE